MRKKIFVMLVYLMFAGAIILTSSTLARYLTTTDPNPTFIIGSDLYFDYTRGDLFRNNQLIVGVETEYEVDGEKFQRIETKNVAPGDNLTYHFYISNFEELGVKANGVPGEFFPQAGATLAMPALGDTYDINCTITYRPIPLDGSAPTSSYTLVTDDFNLPVVSEDTGKIKYEFRVEVIIDNQVPHTTSDDYFGATLSIYLFVDAASKVVVN